MLVQDFRVQNKEPDDLNNTQSQSAHGSFLPNYRNSQLLYGSQNGKLVLGLFKKEYCQGDVCSFQIIKFIFNVNQGTIQKTLMGITQEVIEVLDSQILSTRKPLRAQTPIF